MGDLFMLRKKIASARNIVFFLSSTIPSIVTAFHYHHPHNIEVTVVRLRHDVMDIKKYITERVASDLKKAKRWGKGMAKAFAGISNYAFDAIPFEFFTDYRAIDEAFKRLLEEGMDYIQEKLNQSHLAEFLYHHVVDRITVSVEYRAILRKDPLKMDEFVRRGIVKRDEYMYFTLLNFVVRYYLEHEVSH